MEHETRDEFESFWPFALRSSFSFRVEHVPYILYLRFGTSELALLRRSTRVYRHYFEIFTLVFFAVVVAKYL